MDAEHDARHRRGAVRRPGRAEGDLAEEVHRRHRGRRRGARPRRHAGARRVRRREGAGERARNNPDREFEQLAFTKGKIHTMDGSNRVVEEILIRNGRVVEVGNRVDKHGQTKVVNLKGRTVVPGIVDNHNHIILMGNRPGYHTPLENAYSVADVQQTYAARAAGIPAGGWITTIGGFHVNHLAELRLPTLAELDAAVPANPVFILQGFTGPATTNSLGKAFFQANGVTVADNGAIGTGGQQATRAMLLLRQTLLNPEQRRRGTVDAVAYGLGLGVTAHLDQGAFQKTNTPGRRRGARGQLHDADPVPRAAPRGPAEGPRADQLPAHGDRPGAARRSSSG